MSCPKLAAALLDTIVRDDLYNAVLEKNGCALAAPLGGGHSKVLSVRPRPPSLPISSAGWSGTTTVKSCGHRTNPDRHMADEFTYTVEECSHTSWLVRVIANAMT